jgi:hypothetical protein
MCVHLSVSIYIYIYIYIYMYVCIYTLFVRFLGAHASRGLKANSVYCVYAHVYVRMHIRSQSSSENASVDMYAHV